MMAALALSENVAVLGVAKPRCSLDEHLQHRFEIGPRLADRLEDFTGRGLVFERFLKVARTLARLGRQPRILHRDDRLRREVLQQRYLLIGERTYPKSARDNHSKQCVILP